MYEEKLDIKDGLRNYFDSCGFEIINMDKTIVFLQDENCLFTFEQIISRFCENNEIKCPMEYLDCNMIFSEVQFDYYEVSNDCYVCDEDMWKFELFKTMLKEHCIRKTDWS